MERRGRKGLGIGKGEEGEGRIGRGQEGKGRQAAEGERARLGYLSRGRPPSS